MEPAKVNRSVQTEKMLNMTTHTDINECQDGSNDCDVHTRCNNTLGSYECVCDGGYEENINGDCISKHIITIISTITQFIIQKSLGVMKFVIKMQSAR